MRFFLAFAAAYLLVLPAPGRAQDRVPVVLTPDESVTLRFDHRDADPALVERTPATWTPFELAVARHLVAGIGVDSGSSATLREHEDLPPLPAIAPGLVRLRIFQIAGRQTVLFIENGEDRALVYRATMTRSGRDAPTDVCLVPAHNFANEHWPYPIDQLSLSDLRLVEWNGGDTVPCA